MNTNWKKAMAATVLALALNGLARSADAGDPPKTDDKTVQKDPKAMTLDECEANSICPVTRKPSKPIYHYQIPGSEKVYHFATRDAQKEFQASPEKFGWKKDEGKK
jgi:hypothetical protein